jgi:hypothetical protein
MAERTEPAEVGVGERLTMAELTELVGHMTAGDFWRFTELTGNAQARSIMVALHRVAVSTGKANGEAIDVFLDRVEVSELLRLVGGGSPLVRGAGDGSPNSADIGD